MLAKAKVLVIMGIMVLGALGLLAGPAAARNPNLSNWTINLSGDEPVTEIWNDAWQEIEVVGNTVHVLYWAQIGGTGRDRLYYRRSTDGGQTWQAKILLYDTASAGDSPTVERGWKYLSVDGDYVHVAYRVDSATGETVTYRRSTDNGASFEASRQLFPLEGGVDFMWDVRVSASQGQVSIAFAMASCYHCSSQVFALWSNDNGANFTTVEVFNSGSEYLGARVGDLKRVGDRVYILYRHDIESASGWNNALMCAASLDGGKTFTHNRMTTVAANGKYLTYDIQNADYSPNIAVTGDNVYVVWTQNDTDSASNDRSLYFRGSSDRGQNFGAPVKLAQNQTDGIGDMELGQETVAANGGYVYVVFMTSDGTVYLRRSANGGAAFQPLQTMGAGAWWPNMVVDPANGAKVHVFWVYSYRYSSDGGATFTSPVVLMPFVDGQGGITGVQMALGPGVTKHFTVPLTYTNPAEQDIFYRCLSPAPAPSASNQALHVYTDPNAIRYDCMEVAGSDWVNFTSQMSGEVWVKPSPGGKDTGFTDLKKYVFCKVLSDAIPFTAGSQSDKAYTMGTYDFGDGVKRQAVAEIGTPDGWFSLSAGAWNPIGLVDDNAWTHLAFTYDAGAGANNFKLYKNGQLIASMTATGNINAGPGNFYAGAYGRWDMCELRLWSRALSQAEIQANMRRSLAGNETGLNAYYQFGKTTQDKTGHGNDGILIYMESYLPSFFATSSGTAINALLLD